jgi:hypothetical protein
MVLGLFVVVGCWLIGDVSVTGKIVLTVVYLASFGLLLLGNLSYLFTVAQCLLIVIGGVATFGLDWLIRRH